MESFSLQLSSDFDRKPKHQKFTAEQLDEVCNDIYDQLEEQ